MIEEATSKECSRCKKDKPLSEFARMSRGRHGRQAWCRPCASQDRRDRRAAVRAEAEKVVAQSI